MAQEQLFRARDLIRDKRYAEARRLLVTIDHPKAREWLHKLDEVESRNAAQTVEARQVNPYPPSAPWQAETRLSAMAGTYTPQDRTVYPVEAPPVYSDEKRIHVGHILLAMIGGLIGAAIGAAIWAAVAYLTEYEVGYVAIVVGLLAGLGAVLFSGGRRGPAIQIIAVLMALLGIIVGKLAAVYALIIKFSNEQAGTDVTAQVLQELPPLSLDTLRTLADGIISEAQPVDLLFIVLAALAALAVAARRGPRPAKTR